GHGDAGEGVRGKRLCRNRPERPRGRSDGDRAARAATWIHPRATPAEILPYWQEGAARRVTNKGSSPSGGAHCGGRPPYLGDVKNLNRLLEFFLRPFTAARFGPRLFPARPLGKTIRGSNIFRQTPRRCPLRIPGKTPPR